MRITSYSVEDLRILTLSMAKLGRMNQIDYLKPITPKEVSSNKELDPVEIPFLSPLKAFDGYLQWNWAGDKNPPSKFYIQVLTSSGYTVTCSFSMINTLFSISSLIVLYEDLNLPLKNLADITFDDLIKFLKADTQTQFNFIKAHYSLNEVQELALKR